MMFKVFLLNTAQLLLLLLFYFTIIIIIITNLIILIILLIIIIEQLFGDEIPNTWNVSHLKFYFS